MTSPAAAGALGGLRSVAVGGGGLVGLAAAYKLARAGPGLAVTVLAKEPAVARHQSGHNSGVLHARLHYAPGSAEARLAGERPALRIVPFRGEHFALRPERRHLVRHLIYPVPDPTFPFLGVHLTRMIGGGVECGPNAVLALAREGYRKTTVSARDVADALAFPGLWRFLARHPRTTASELGRSISRRLFAAALRRLVPELEEGDLEPGGAGVRAQAMLPSGELVQDFHLVARRDALHVLDAPSPGATASLAIGDEIVRMAARARAQRSRLPGAPPTPSYARWPGGAPSLDSPRQAVLPRAPRRARPCPTRFRRSPTRPTRSSRTSTRRRCRSTTGSITTRTSPT